ncbi:MAG: DoxX family membrane protein [Anaerolineales bacterium]
MEWAFLVGRIIVGVFWLFNAFNHFAQGKMMIPYAKSKGVPLAEVAVPGTGLLLLIGGLSFLTGLYPTIGIAALVLFLVPTTFMMHNFWAVQDPQMKMVEMVNFNKNLALLGFLLISLLLPQPWPFSF